MKPNPRTLSFLLSFYLTVGGALLLAGCTTPVLAGPDSWVLSEKQVAAINSIIDTAMQQAPYPGSVVVVNYRGVEIFSSARGFADLENLVPVTLDSVFAIGSITKSFTALAVLQQVEKGLLELDDTLAQLIPGYQGPAASVTVRQLLNHTSGIPNYLHEIPAVQGTFERRASTREEMVSYFLHEDLLFEPGTRWSYTNSGYYLLGMILETISGLDYYEYLQKNIAEPFGLASLNSGDDSQLVQHRVHGYHHGGQAWVNAPPWHYLVPYAAGSLLADAHDLVAYRRAVFQSAHVSADLLKLITKTSALADGTVIQYALGGLIASEFHGHQKYSHSGEIYGYYSNHAYYPDDDLTVVILTNNQGTTPSPVWMERKIARVVLGIPQPTTLRQDQSEYVLQQLVGDYKVGPVRFGPETYGFLMQQGQLFLRFGGQDSGAPLIPLLALGNGEFMMADDDEWRFVFELSGSHATGFAMSVRDATVRGNYVPDRK